jgi:hypothetical protein
MLSSRKPKNTRKIQPTLFEPSFAKQLRMFVQRENGALQVSGFYIIFSI